MSLLYLIILGVFIVAIVLYKFKDIIIEENLTDNIPTISANKEQLKSYDIKISKNYKSTRKSNYKRKLFKELDISYKKILETYNYIDKRLLEKKDISITANWLLDNLYFIEKEYKDIKNNMCKNNYNNLPIINKGVFKGYPRIYELSIELISRANGKIDKEVILKFINSYQKSNILKSAEIWALYNMLKVGLIQNISKVCSNLLDMQSQRKEADVVADIIINGYNNKNLESTMNEIYKKDIKFNPYFVERLVILLRDNGIEDPCVYNWINKKLDFVEGSIERYVSIANEREANYQFIIGNCINSIRFIESLNWRSIFEELSYVDSILMKDPLNIYKDMDFQSKDYYRKRIEKLSVVFNVPESLIVKKAIECANNPKGEQEYLKHVGYYIVDKGITELKNRLNINKNIKKLYGEYNPKFYILAVGILTALVMSIFIYLSVINDNNINIWRYIIACLVLIVPCSQIVISILNWSISKLVCPRFIPKLQLTNGIPKEASTIVVIPTLINNKNRAIQLVKDLEVYYLANKEDNLYFAILGDFKDSNKKEEFQDKDIIKTTLNEIKNLNKKYSNNNKDIFYFFNRYRKFNNKENKWMGWERKRGKLMEFNKLLKGDKKTTYNIVSGNLENLKDIKYVITLDADTKLPRDTAKKLIGSMMHVLNIPYVKEGKVVRGYGIMQPRIAVSTVSANKTIFSKIFSGETGIDTYTTAVSDVYQDLFGEGIFTGKGIYNLDVFINQIEGKIKENSVLSHDLLEGCLVRTGLLTDLELIDSYPAYYNSSAMRLHRWVRGDWQLIPWLFKKSSLNFLSKWKIVDNMRRSLLTPSIVLLILLSFTILPDGTDKWLVAAILSIITPILFDVSETVIFPVKEISLTGKIKDLTMAIDQVFLIFCFIPYKAYLMTNAIIKTIYRLLISKKNLLEWQTAADTEILLGRKLKDYIISMSPGSIIAILIEILAFYNSKHFGFIMLPSCIIWFISPIIAYYISKDNNKAKYHITKNENLLLRKLSRKTWAYFEDFVNEDSNFLAPDNFQLQPYKGVSYRTSPTNMGMGLTSNIVAKDMGYINTLQMVSRIENILNSMQSLEKYNGHFYNWYDIKTKRPLYPKYISTVDSGNLVGYLWLTSQALDECINEPFINKNLIKGIKDTIALALEEIQCNDKKDIYKEVIGDYQLKNLDIIALKNIFIKIINVYSEIEFLKEDKKLYWNNKLKDMVVYQLESINNIFPYNYELEKLKNINVNLYNQISTLIINCPLKDISRKIEALLKESTNIENENKQILEQLRNSKVKIEKLILKITNLKSQLEKMAEDTDFKILYDNNRQLFTIGYDMESKKISNCYYDLLASESRQASFVAIAKGDIPKIHWFKLGRSLGIMGKGKGLVSWTGTMFEYLMPLLIMKNYSDTLLYETYNNVIRGQIDYIKNKDMPWGISESAYYKFDDSLNYQYKAFGVPGIGLKRGLFNEMVISPYSTILALQIDTKDSIDNIKTLINEGAEGKYGFYDAIDYTKNRIPNNTNKKIIKNFMVHHEGMSLMALDNVLNNNILQERFHKIPKVKATELLLQEKISKNIVYDRQQQFDIIDTKILGNENKVLRKFNTSKTKIPECQLLSRGNYSVMVTNSGSGYSKKEDITLYRYIEDSTTNSKGMFFYIRNVTDNKYWSASYEPCKTQGEDYEVTFGLDEINFKRKDHDIQTKMDICISSEDDAEIRRITITNNSDEEKVIEITSYLEVTLSTYQTDIVHPAFSNLFITTKFIDNPYCIIGSRRPRSKNQSTKQIMQTVAIEGNNIGGMEYETSRMKFIGRGRTLRNPIAVEEGVKLKNSIGAVLDPIISIRTRLRLNAGEKGSVIYTTAVTQTEAQAIELANKYRDINNINRIFNFLWANTQYELKSLGVKAAQANLYQLMASRILFLNPNLKNRSKYIKNLTKGQRALWSYGISGDIPIVCILIKDDKNLDILRQSLIAHSYWNIKGLKVDLLIIKFQSDDYMKNFNGKIEALINNSPLRDRRNKPGGIFVLNKVDILKEDYDLFMAISRIVIDSDKGILSNQIDKSFVINNTISSNEIHKNCIINNENSNLQLEKNNYNYIEKENYNVEKLKYYNSIGGFDVENKEYVIVLKKDQNTPLPWINVISNNNFGFHVSESGSSYTWNKNSRENKITPWSNDPVVDEPSEVMYIKDEITKDVWTLSSKPIRDNKEYVIRHGFGYSVFNHETNGIDGSITMFAAREDSVKLCLVSLKNKTNKNRKLSITYYARLVLGVVPENTYRYISTYIDHKEKYIYAKNPYNENFATLISYLSIVGGNCESFCGSREKFLGRGEDVSNPNALYKDNLSNTVGAGIDPCMSEKIHFDLKKNEEKKFVIILGEGENKNELERVIDKFTNINNVENELEKVKDYWRSLVNKIVVKTPDETMNILLNGWLIYQVLSCRLWARTAFYQSGGAYGFRDQLQDVMAISYLNPKITRKQILYSASRQFIQGDVQHWWHPVVNSGIRTRFSDDLLWLPFVTLDYIKNTQDYSILDEKVGYLEDDELKYGEDERYTISKESKEIGTIYEHCIKAIEKSLKFGEHNIPLMGSGDWNDGMNEIGNEGKGESVWLGWFLYSILDGFDDLCRYKSDDKRALRYVQMKNFIKENLEKNAWDGEWYRRAYFDNGTPLGSIENEECKIDSLSQSWSIISGAANKKRAKSAMKAVFENLVLKNKGIILLLTPAFDKSNLEPGYIKGYVPGVRENGGQYTHASIWVILALTKLGYGEEAVKLFDMINPINHSKSFFGAETYKVEPYVMAADVYAIEPHTGRGGWTWYTGAAGWMYRVGIEGILGMKIRGNSFCIKPCIPDSWSQYSIEYNMKNCKYNINIIRGKEKSIKLDGKIIKGEFIPIIQNGEHSVEIVV